MPASAEMASAALGLNDRSDIVGGYRYDNTGADQVDSPAPPGMENRHAFLRHKGYIIRLWPGVARSINNRGWIVGLKDVDYDNDRSAGILWRNGRTTLFEMQPIAINERGEIAGNIPINGDPGKACLWRQGEIIHLSKQLSRAYALNNLGDVVGEQENAAPFPIVRAVLWKDSRTYDLNRCVSLPKGWVLERAIGINDKGWIIGEGGVYKKPKDTQAVKLFTFLLTPR